MTETIHESQQKHKYGIQNLLMLRGLAREQRHWGDLPKQIEADTGLKTLCIDLPGMGTEARRVCPTQIQDITDDLRERFLRAKFASNPQREPIYTGNWAIFAASLGGMILADWCARYPADFHFAFVVNSSAANLSLPWERFQPHNYTRIVKAALTPDLVTRERTILEITTDGRNIDRQKLAERSASFAAETKPSRSVLLRQLAAAVRYRAPAKLPMPAAVFYSQGDTLVDPICSQRLAKRWGVLEYVHPWAGHDLPLDDPMWIREQIKACLRP